MPNILIRPAVARVAISLTFVMAATAAHAQQTPVPPPAPSTQQREHKVKPGDTLWDLAKFYLSDPWAWRLIYEANRAVVENPHWIYPAETIIIPGMTPSVPLGEPQRPAPVPVEVVVDVPESDPAPVNVSLDLRRPIIPVAEYMAAPWIQMAPESDVVGRIVRLADPSADDDKLPSTLHPNMFVRLGNLKGTRQIGDSLVIVRFTRGVGSYGKMVEPLGVLRVDSITPTIVTAKVVRQFGAARVGDNVMVMRAVPEIGLGLPQPVNGGAQGELIEFVNNEPLHGTTDIGFVSLGKASGISIGDEFEVYVPARALDNERPEVLPNTTIATVRVVRVNDRTSTVRVLNVNSAALRVGLPVRLIRKMN